ncbi:MAG: hypothetical protein ABFD08_18925 [Syntrophomonas sp.]
MQTSVWKRFAALYGKEMRELLPEMLVVLGLVTVTTVLYYLNPGDYSRLIIIPYIMLAGLVGLLPFISSCRLSREWSSNTIYMVMSLPVKGGMILGTKLLALLSQYLINSAFLIMAGFLLVLPHLNLINSGDMAQLNALLQRGFVPMLLAYLLSLAGLSYIISLSFFSQLAGKLVSRFSGAFTVLVFIGTFWLSGHLVDLIMVQTGLQLEIKNQFQLVESANAFLGLNSFILASLALLLLGLGASVYNRRIEL